jgi:uncharacterized protein with PIN domain
MKRINLCLPSHYKELFFEIAKEDGISASELLRRWIHEHELKLKRIKNARNNKAIVSV